MKLGMFSMDSRGVVKMVPILAEDVLNADFFTPTLKHLHPEAADMLDPPYNYVRVDRLVWVDVNNVDGGVAMVLPRLISDPVAKSALSAAWREWGENKEELKTLTRKVAEMTVELNQKRALLRFLAENPLARGALFRQLR